MFEKTAIGWDTMIIVELGQKKRQEISIRNEDGTSSSSSALVCEQAVIVPFSSSESLSHHRE